MREESVSPVVCSSTEAGVVVEGESGEIEVAWEERDTSDEEVEVTIAREVTGV